jgi:hypothetical protein
LFEYRPQKCPSWLRFYIVTPSKFRDDTSLGQQMLPSKYFSSHHSSINHTFDAIKTWTLVASLNNSEYKRNGNVSSVVPRHPDYTEERWSGLPGNPDHREGNSCYR